MLHKKLAKCQKCVDIHLNLLYSYSIGTFFFSTLLIGNHIETFFSANANTSQFDYQAKLTFITKAFFMRGSIYSENTKNVSYNKHKWPVFRRGGNHTAKRQNNQDSFTVSKRLFTLPLKRAINCQTFKTFLVNG